MSEIKQVLRQGILVNTPEGYCIRDDGLISHVYTRIDGSLEWVEVPSMESLESMMVDACMCETPEGDCVEPDHPKSWLRLLGLI